MLHISNLIICHIAIQFNTCFYKVAIIKYIIGNCEIKKSFMWITLKITNVFIGFVGLKSGMIALI